MNEIKVPNLGELADDNSRRDAIHVAVAPVIAGERLLGGMHILLRDGKAYMDTKYVQDNPDIPVVGVRTDKTIGVVDPFFDECILPDQKFWLLLYPGSITSLRHVFTHPAFKVQLPTNGNDSKWIPGEPQGEVKEV